MKNEKLVTIKGKLYDRNTGLPIKTAQPTTTKPSLSQRSHDMYQRAVQKTALHSTPLMRKVGQSMDIARSKSITRFSQRPVSQTIKQVRSDIGPIRHPLANRVEHIRSMARPQVAKLEVSKTPKAIKEEAIAEAFKKVSEKPKIKKNIFRHHKFVNIFSASIILILGIGYLMYLNMPNISVLVASAQAGINAKYPEYRPDGYSTDGPVSYKSGEVTINFKSNTGNDNFTIKQAKSSWDSSAVKNMVDKDSKSEFITTEERGLTIYTYNGNAAWVNGGILYTINGNAPLSGDQIRRIAVSL